MEEKRDNLVKAFMEFAEDNPNFGAFSEQVLTTLFLGYKERKRTNKLYTEDAGTATSLIGYYYLLNLNEISFDHMKKAFVTKYCTNESKIEGVNDDGRHGTDEIKGMKVMYDYIHSDEIDDIIYTKNIGWGQKKDLVKPGTFRITGYESSSLRDTLFANTGLEFALMELHKKLYSLSEFPDDAQYVRTDVAHLGGDSGGVELCDWTQIGSQLKYLDFECQRLLEEAKRIKNTRNPEGLLKYLDDCVILNCKLIQVHPFFDGNGRTVRAFTNKLLEDAGLPPIYIKSNEREEYHKAMHDAICDVNYSAITGFYRYKVCDSIIELDINDRVNAMYNSPEDATKDEEKSKK